MNISEIARRAGVSRSTVSYVLSGKRQVSDEIRARVNRVVEESGYRPSATARALAEGSTRAFGLVIPPMGGHLSVDQLRFVGAVAENAAEHDYDILLSPSGDGKEAAFDRMVGERRVDGVVVMETLMHDSRVSRLLDAGLPFVTIGRTGFDALHGWVDLDYAGLVAAAVSRLHDLGHIDVALVNRPQALLDREYGPAYRALEAFEKQAAELDLAGLAACCEDEAASGARCVRELLHRSPELTGLVVVNERALPGVLGALREAGRSVPRDVSVVAVTSEDNALALRPAVTAADVPTAAMGWHAVDALLRRVRQPTEEPAHVLLSPAFVPRGSDGPAGRPHHR